MTIVDSGAWFATFVNTDPDHALAAAWYDGNEDSLITTDYIVDETLTLLRARGQRRTSLRVGEQLWAGELAAVHFVTPEQIAAAWTVFRNFADKAWSFTDCTSRVVIDALGITKAFSFDRHFRQFGNVVVVPPESA